MPGYDVRVVDEQCRKEVPRKHHGLDRGQAAAAAGCLPTLWQQDERFRESYLAEFPGYYKTADAGFKDEDGYLYVMGRTDDIINVAGHRLSTGGMEEVLAAHQDVAECAVVGIKDALKGEVPAASSCSRPASTVRPPRSSRSAARWCARRSARSPPSSSPSRWRGCRRRARARILRGTIKKIADGEPWTMPATIDDPAILDEIGTALKGRGVGANGGTAQIFTQ